jgi:hypothetical protein
LRDIANQTPLCGEVAFTIQRPLAASRTLSFPRMRRAELESVLSRDWTRYVIGLRPDAHVAAARAGRSGQWRAAFAPVETLEALEAGARDLGWAVRDVRTSDDALAAAAQHVQPSIARMEAAVVVLCSTSSATDVAGLHRGIPRSGRQLVAGTTAEVMAFIRQSAAPDTGDDATVPQTATVVVLGDLERGETLAKELGRAGLRAQYIRLASFAKEQPAALLAAASLLAPAALPLIAPSEQASRLRRARVATWWLAAAAVLLVAAGFAIENQRLVSDLAAVSRQRATIASQVGNAVASRAQLESSAEAAATLAEHEAQASHASVAIAAITLTLPKSASLSMLQVARDSLMIEGESSRSADVYNALRAAPTLEAVRLAGPLRQERQADDSPVEHFAFVAKLRRGAR